MLIMCYIINIMSSVSANALPLHRSEQPFRANGVAMDGWIAELERAGEDVGYVFLDKLEDTRFIEGLQGAVAKRGENALDYIMQSNRFSRLVDRTRFDGLTRNDDHITIPNDPGNTARSVHPRPAEQGRRIQLDFVYEQGVDPRYVLFFRVTQPPTNGPKPEYYWTTDLAEVMHGLTEEGAANGEPIILVASLEAISRNGGLMADINDDQGLAVRQIGSAPFDQQDALFSFPR